MNQTIAAIATGPVSGPIGIIRVSGPDTMAVIDRIFHPQDGSAMSGKPSPFSLTVRSCPAPVM